MRFLHLADLHLGKMIYGTSLIDNGDQKVWVERFLEKVRSLKPDAVVIAGDVYDRGQPSGKAVQLLSSLVTELAEMDIAVMMIAGNHDSVQLLSFLSPLLANQKVYISRPLDQSALLTHVTMEDEYGPVTFWLMPYVFPAIIAQAVGEDELRGYDAAVRRLLQEQPIDFTQRNVLIAHQNVTANGKEVERGGSESMVGGVGQVDFTVFDGFDYVALGHIHSAYAVGRETVRYAGTPLAYHFDETRQPDKGPLLVTLSEKGMPPVIEKQTIEPLHRMRVIRDTYDHIRDNIISNPWRNEYLKIILTDRRVSPEVSDYLREAAKANGSTVFEMTSEFSAHTAANGFSGTKDIREKTVEELFADFYTYRHNGVEPDEKDLELMSFVGELTRTSLTGPAEPDEKDFLKILSFVLGQEVSRK